MCATRGLLVDLTVVLSGSEVLDGDIRRTGGNLGDARAAGSFLSVSRL